jgi:predicted aspartyl protease
VSRRVIAGLLIVVPVAVGCADARVTPVRAQRTLGPQAAGPGRTPTLTPAPVPVPTTAKKHARISLPLRIVRGNGGTLVYVPMKVNGRGPFEFVLDTGSSNSSVDRSLVRTLGLPRTGQMHPVQGVTGSGVVPVVKLRKWTLGGVSMHGRSLSVVDLGIGVGGLLGSDELCRFGNVTLDFQHNRLLIDRR